MEVKIQERPKNIQNQGKNIIIYQKGIRSYRKITSLVVLLALELEIFSNRRIIIVGNINKNVKEEGKDLEIDIRDRTQLHNKCIKKVLKI